MWWCSNENYKKATTPSITKQTWREYENTMKQKNLHLCKDLLTGLLSVVCRILTTVELTRPCESGSTCTTRAKDQALCGTFFSGIIMTSPSTRLCLVWCYLCLSCITSRYYFFHQDQNTFAKYCTFCHCWSTYTSLLWNFPGGGIITGDLVLKMWFGVSGSRLLHSPETVIRGLELIVATTSQMRIWNDSSSMQWTYSSINLARTFLVVLIWCYHLAAVGLKSMFSLFRLVWISSWSISSLACRNLFHVATKFVPSSLLISLTRLWLEFLVIASCCLIILLFMLSTTWIKLCNSFPSALQGIPAFLWALATINVLSFFHSLTGMSRNEDVSHLSVL